MRGMGIVALLLMAGCASDSGGRTEGMEAAWIHCTNPRPQVCTMEYMPVCARLNEDGRKTYDNGCNACADHRVVSYRPGRCENSN